ncbi:MAG TPA: glycosyltransferase family 9 protein [Verrucomicrobiae bacterium]|jgi:ADP-heptose:LPS heptosyltransferase|nr:glycosyltransferase family 9 protein [Verrucomicrobiae bacterium]
MVLDLGFLGDTIHLLPALWMVRQAYPRAELHVTVASHIVSLMDCVLWVDRVRGYMRYPRHATLRENLAFIRSLRREKFDVLINLNGSDRSCWLTFFSGARERLGRWPDDRSGLFRKFMFTERIRYRAGDEPAYVSKCRYLAEVGFPFNEPEFHVEIAPEHLRPSEISETDKGTYFHISPFTTADHKELSPEQLAELIAALRNFFPEKKVALSCAPIPHELEKMEKLLALLPQKPWRVFAGNLNLIQIAAVIKHSALHFCGDTGTLHIAVMTQTPLVAWFWPNPALRAWMPTGQKYCVLMGENRPGATFLCNIATDALIERTRSVLTQ